MTTSQTTHKITVERTVARVAYARNGNLHNPTRYFMYHAKVDGVTVCSNPRRSYAVEVAQAYIASGEADAK